MNVQINVFLCVPYICASSLQEIVHLLCLCMCVCAGVDRRAKVEPVHLLLQTRRVKTQAEEDGEKEGAASPVFPNPG